MDTTRESLNRCSTTRLPPSAAITAGVSTQATACDVVTVKSQSDGIRAPCLNTRMSPILGAISSVRAADTMATELASSMPTSPPRMAALATPPAARRAPQRFQFLIGRPPSIAPLAIVHFLHLIGRQPNESGRKTGSWRRSHVLWRQGKRSPNLARTRLNGASVR